MGTSELAKSSPVDLPLDLEREIFEIGARLSLSSAANLLLVARRVYEWVEPILYSVVRVDTFTLFPPIYQNVSPTILDEARLKHIGPHVRHVLLQCRIMVEITAILNHCASLQNLALWMPQGSASALIPLLQTLPLRKLSFDPSCFFYIFEEEDVPIPFRNPMFNGITHLDIINCSPRWSKWQALAAIPGLTHLALAGRTSEELIQRILCECLQLQLLILFQPVRASSGEKTDYSHLEDKRLVCLDPPKDLLDHWERGARGGEDFWVTAEEYMEGSLLGISSRK